jgi:phosphatidylglycerophosphatase A
LKIVIEILSTIFFVGYLPASGTFSTLVSFPIVLLMSKLSFIYQTIIVFILVLLGIFFSSYAEKVFNKKDDSRIVIDEFVGFLVACMGVKISDISVLLVSFLLFRIFDIFKFGMISKLQKLPGGVGIMIDDIVAGIITNFFVRIIKF